jgi:serine/threonine-protein kinase
MRLMPLSTRETFAGFRIVRLLGSGGMAEVFLAEHPGCGGALP